MVPKTWNIITGYAQSVQVVWKSMSLSQAASGLWGKVHMLQSSAGQTNRSEKLIECVHRVCSSNRHTHHIRTWTVHVGSSW